MWDKNKKKYKTLTSDQIEEIADREIKEYTNSQTGEYGSFMLSYIYAASLVDHKRFLHIQQTINNTQKNNKILKHLFENNSRPDPILLATVKDVVSEVMNKLFPTTKFGNFTIKDDIYGKQKIVFITDPKTGKLMPIRMNPAMIQGILANLIKILNDGTTKIVMQSTNSNIWYQSIFSLFVYGNSAIYLDTGIDYEHFIPYNIELTDISWLQNNKNEIDRVFCKKRYKLYQLKNDFNEDQVELIKKLSELTEEEDDTKQVELLHIVCPNPIPSQEREAYTVIGKDKDYISLILCKDKKDKKEDNKHQFKIIKVGGYDKMPYLITRINKTSELDNYGYSLILTLGEHAKVNAEHQSDTNDIASIKGKPPRLEVPGFIEGGSLNMNRRGMNRAKIDEGRPLPQQPVSILQSHDADAMQSLFSAIQMNREIMDTVLVRTERNQITRNAGDINNYVSQLLDSTATIKMSPMTSAIEAELKKPLFEFIGNYFILHEFNQWQNESYVEINMLALQLKNIDIDPKDYELYYLKKNLPSKSEEISGYWFLQKIWFALTGQRVSLFKDDNNIEIMAQLAYFWDVVFNYDSENTTMKSRFNIKSIKNIELELVPIREEVAIMQDVNLKIQVASQLLQLAMQLDPVTAQTSINFEWLFEYVRTHLPTMKNFIRNPEDIQILKEQMMQQQQAQQQQQQGEQQQGEQQSQEEMPQEES